MIAAAATVAHRDNHDTWSIPVELLATFDTPSDARAFSLVVQARVTTIRGVRERQVEVKTRF